MTKITPVKYLWIIKYASSCYRYGGPTWGSFLCVLAAYRPNVHVTLLGKHNNKKAIRLVTLKQQSLT